MALDLRTNLKLTQNLLMTPQLQQAIKLLQLSRFELEQFVSTQLAENPVLEEGQTESMEEKIQVDREKESTLKEATEARLSEAIGNVSDSSSSKEDSGNDVDWESMTRYNEQSQSTYKNKSNAEGTEANNYENYVSASTSLVDVLNQQLSESDLDEVELKIAEILVGNIDEKGYLPVSLEELSTQEGISKDDLEDVLDVVQRFDPPGVGARDLKECLLNQIKFSGRKNGVIEKIIEDHLKDLESRNLNAIAKSLKIPVEKVIENVQQIMDLEPIPGRPYSTEMAQIIIPDVYVFKLAGKWVVSLNEDGIPRLQVNAKYNELLNNPKRSEGDKTYINEKFKSANWLIKSIQQRQNTILKVSETILEKQVDFFDKGTQFLKPMILKDVAEAIEMHESTVSRVTNNKYMHTPRGVFELKYFFSSSVSRGDGGDDMSSESVKNIISDIVKAENPKRPFSDQKIVDMLAEKDIKLARRTVAKYRDQLGILPSSKRKKLF